MIKQLIGILLFLIGLPLFIIGVFFGFIKFMFMMGYYFIDEKLLDIFNSLM